MTVFQIYKGLDFWRNLEPAWGDHGSYATRLFSNETVKIIMEHDTSNPLLLYVAHVGVHCGNSYNQMPVPMDTYEMFSYIKDEKRRKLASNNYCYSIGAASLIGQVNEGVGKVTNVKQFLAQKLPMLRNFLAPKLPMLRNF